MNLRERVERDLAVSLEGRWGLPVILTSPDGERQGDLKGQVLYGIRRIDPDSGNEIVVDTPAVTLRRSSLTRVPLAGERWIVEIPASVTDATMKPYHLTPDRPPEGGKSVGFIRLYLQEVEQSP